MPKLYPCLDCLNHTKECLRNGYFSKPENIGNSQGNKGKSLMNSKLFWAHNVNSVKRDYSLNLFHRFSSKCNKCFGFGGYFLNSLTLLKGLLKHTLWIPNS